MIHKNNCCSKLISSKVIISVVLFWVGSCFQTVVAAPLIYADGDLAPLGTPDGLIDPADYLIANRIVLEQITATSMEMSHGDVYPVGAPDGIIDIHDMLLIQKQVLGQGGNWALTAMCRILTCSKMALLTSAQKSMVASASTAGYRRWLHRPGCNGNQ